MVIEPKSELFPLGMAPPCPMASYQFPKRKRLLVASDFERVFAARSSAADGMLVLYGAPSGLEYPRLGLVVSRRLGNSVARNRWKRALREAFRLTQHALPPLDLVCLPRPAARPEFHRLCESFPVLATRIARRFERDKQG